MLRLVTFLMIFLCSLNASELKVVPLSLECEPEYTIADCVDLTTGHFYQQTIDFESNTIDPLRIERMYNSGVSRESSLGLGFDCGRESTLEGKKFKHLKKEKKTNGNKVKYTYTKYKGKTCLSRIYTVNRAGTVINEVNFEHRDGQSKLLSSCGQIVEYNWNKSSPGNQLLTSVFSTQKPTTYYQFKSDLHSAMTGVDKPHGQYLKVNYKKNKVLSIEKPGYDGSVQQFSFEYNKDSTKVTDAMGASKLYLFDSQKRLRAIHWGNNIHALKQVCFVWNKDNTLASKCIVQGDTLLQKETYKYDSKGNLISKKWEGQLTGERECLEAREMHYEYNKKNQLVTEITPEGLKIFYEYLPGTQLRTKKLEHYNGGIQERFFTGYDDNGEVSYSIEDDGCGTEESDLTNVTYRRVTKYVAEKDKSKVSFGKPIEIIEEDLDQNLMKRTVLVYDARGYEVERSIYGADNQFCYKTSKVFDRQGRLLNETDALGYSTNYVYDENNNIVEEEQAGSGYRTFYTYNSANQLVKKEFLSFFEEYAYDCKDQLIRKKDRYSNETCYAYDEMGRETNTTKAEGQVHKTYNALNQMTSLTDENGFTTKYHYNIYGSPTRITHPDGTFKRCIYYPNGWLRQAWLENNASYYYCYDGKGRVISKRLCDIPGTHVREEKFIYKGDLLIESIDVNGVSTTYQYDKAGRKIKEMLEDYKTVNFEYDSLGRVSAQFQTFSGFKEVYTYDWLGRITSKSKVGKKELFSKEEYAYDVQGRKTLTKVYKTPEEFALYSKVYDAEGHLIAETDALGFTTTWKYEYGQTLLVTKIDPRGFAFVDEYCPEGRLIRSTMPDLSSIEYLYDSKGNLTQKVTKVYQNGEYQFDQAIDYEYNSRDLVVHEMKNPGNAITRYSYDVNGRLTTKRTPVGYNVCYLYSYAGPTGYISSDSVWYVLYLDKKNNAFEISDGVNAATYNRVFDKCNRLIMEERNKAVVVKYFYNAFDQLNLMELPDHSFVRYIYKGPRLVKVDRCDTFGNYLYSCELDYDLCGNVVEIRTPAGTQVCEYDLAGKCTSVATAQWSSMVKSSDENGNILKMQVKDPTSRWSQSRAYDTLNHVMKDNKNVYAFDSLGNCVGINGIIREITKLYPHDRNGNLLSDGHTSYKYDATNRLVNCQNDSGSTRLRFDYYNRCFQINDKQLFHLNQHEVGSMLDNKLHEFRVVHPETGRTLAIELEGQCYFPVQDPQGNVCALQDSQGQVVQWVRYNAFGEAKKYGNLSIQNPWGYANNRCVEDVILFDGKAYNPKLKLFQTANF